MIEGSPQQFEFPEIAIEIQQMADLDQEMRKKWLDDHSYWDKDVDKNNTERLKVIIEKIGWPTISKVGAEASANAWLLAQHADRDIEFQKKCLSLMKDLPEGEVNPKNIAHLTDRVCVNSKEPQIYGTQFNQDKNGNFVPKELDNPKDVDNRRIEMGLDTLEENIKRMHEKYYNK